jgi:chemotaxis protein CheX
VPSAAPVPTPHMLPESLDLTQAGELARTLVGARGADIVVDASQVGRIGTQCVQVLLAAALSWPGEGFRFQLVHPSDAFSEALRLLGLQTAFACEEPSL